MWNEKWLRVADALLYKKSKFNKSVFNALSNHIPPKKIILANINNNYKINFLVPYA